jgi:hypothetical protein
MKCVVPEQKKSHRHYRAVKHASDRIVIKNFVLTRCSVLFYFPRLALSQLTDWVRLMNLLKPRKTDKLIIKK